MPSGDALKRDAGGKKGELLCCKRIFDRIEGNLAEIQPKNHQTVQKTHVLQKVPGVNGLIYLSCSIWESPPWALPIAVILSSLRDGGELSLMNGDNNTSGINLPRFFRNVNTYRGTSVSYRV